MIVAIDGLFEHGLKKSAKLSLLEFNKKGVAVTSF